MSQHNQAAKINNTKHNIGTLIWDSSSIALQRRQCQMETSNYKCQVYYNHKTIANDICQLCASCDLVETCENDNIITAHQREWD